jgi:hypothetical protein
MKDVIVCLVAGGLNYIGFLWLTLPDETTCREDKVKYEQCSDKDCRNKYTPAQCDVKELIRRKL